MTYFKSPRYVRFCALALAASGYATGQAQAPFPASYVLGPDDQIALQAPDIVEISGKPVRIDLDGHISLPLIGRVPAAGLTAEQFEAHIKDRFKTYLRKPDISVSVVEFRSQPVSVFGSVQNPGVHQLQGSKNLFEVLSLAGGLRPDAGATVKITRRLKWGRIPLSGAADDASGQFSVASIQVRSILSAANPAENIVIRPEDVISVPRADLIYAIGAVRKAGGFVLGEHESISVLQALALAEGLDRLAAAQHGKILRPTENSGNRTEIPVDIKKILAGTSADIPLKADDILFVPTSGAKSAAIRTFEAVVQIGTGIAIYRR